MIHPLVYLFYGGMTAFTIGLLIWADYHEMRNNGRLKEYRNRAVHIMAIIFISCFWPFLYLACLLNTLQKL